MKIAFFMSESNNYLGGADNTLLQQAVLMAKRHKVIVVLPKNKEAEYNRELAHRCSLQGLQYYILYYATANKIKSIDFFSIKESVGYIEEFVEKENINLLHTVQLNVAVEVVSRKKEIPHLMNIYPYTAEGFPFYDIFPHYMSSDSQLYCDMWSDYFKNYARCIRPYSNVCIDRKRNNPVVTFCVVGTVCEYKNQLEVIKAIEIVKNEIPEVKLIVAGYDTSLYARKCKEYVEKNNLSSHVIFEGFVSDIKKVLVKTEVLVCGSTWESFPASIVEAVTCGIPIISTPVGGVIEVFDNEKNAYITEGYTSEDIAQSINNFLQDRMSGQIVDIQKNAKNTYKYHFSEETVGQQLEDYYQFIVNDFPKQKKDKDVVEKLITEVSKMFELLGEMKHDFEFIKFATERWTYFYFISKLIMSKECYIWGAGKWGKYVKTIIVKTFPDLKVKGFIDSKKKGRYEGIDIINPEMLKTKKEYPVLLAFSGDKQQEIKWMQKLGYKREQNLFVID